MSARAIEDRERLRELLSAVAVAAYTTDREGRITFYNDAAAQLWGCRPTLNSAQWCDSLRLLRPDGTPLPQSECAIAVALKEQRIVAGTVAMAERADGSRVKFMAFPSLLRDSSGTISGAINILVDLTKHKDAQGDATRFATVIEASDSAIYSTDNVGNIDYWNKGAELLFGFAAEEIVGHSIKTLFPSDVVTREEANIVERLRHGETVDKYETVRRCKDGTLIDVSVIISPIRNANGNIIGTLRIPRDITAQKQTDKLLRFLASVVESSDDAIVTKDLNGVITTWNNGAQRLFGYTANEVVGKPVTILIPPDREDEEPAILERLRRGERIDHYETVRRTKDGRLLDVSLTVSPVTDSKGVIIGASKIARDVTERKRAEAQMAVLAREAEHRTKNILATVQATVQLTQADTTADLKAAIEGRIQSLATVHNLFVESRWAGAEFRSLIAKELAPYCGVEDVDARAQIDGASLMLEPNVAQTMAVTIHELATNAAKYGALSASKGQIHVAWSRTPDGLLNLRWVETGGPPVTSPARKGFGVRVMGGMIQQMKGSIRFDWHPQGLACEITIPIG